MTENQDPKLVELPIRLSHSKLWPIQRNYFSSMGIKAWREEVPFYISSNAFIGQQYAMLALAYIKDWLTKHPFHVSETFYLLEVGSGTGKFSFYMLKALKSLLEEYKLSHIKFCYVISDIVENNINFCLENACLKPFIEQGVCDFAYFNVETDSDFELRLKKTTFSKLKSKTPLIFIANYTFDCIKQDEFEYENNKFYEIRMGIKSRYKHFDVEKALHLNDLRLHFERVELSDIDNYYENEALNQMLKDYPATFKSKKASIMMPIGAFDCCDNLNKMTHNNVFMIVGDKGVSIPSRFHLYGDRHRYTYDGCFSFLVNFHAIGEYVKRNGGDYYLCSNSNDFNVNLYTMGMHFSELTQTKAYFEQHVQPVGPEEFIYIYDEYLTNGFRFSPRAIQSYLRLSEWDPNAYAAVHERLIELLPVYSKQFIEDIKVDLHRIIDNIYDINIGDDVFNLVGMFVYLLGEEDKALGLFERSLAVYGEKSAPHNNLGVLYEKQKNNTKALYHFEKSVALDKHNRYAKNKILQLSGKPYLSMISPIIKGLFVVGLIALALYAIRR